MRVDRVGVDLHVPVGERVAALRSAPDHERNQAGHAAHDRGAEQGRGEDRLVVEPPQPERGARIRVAQRMRNPQSDETVEAVRVLDAGDEAGHGSPVVAHQPHALEAQDVE